MLAKLKNFVKNNGSDVFIILAVILVALIAFGIGRLTAPKSEPIQIKNLEKESIEDLIVLVQENTGQGIENVNYQGKVVGSVKSETH